MNETIVVHVERCEEQEEYPEGTIGYMGLEIAATQETGKLHIVEFVVPMAYGLMFVDTLEWDDEIALMYFDSASSEIEMLGVKYVWTALAVYAIGRNG